MLCRRRQIIALITTLAAALTLQLGCSNNRRPSATTQPVARQPATKPVVLGKPLLDFSKGAGGFPLVSDRLPSGRNELIDAITKAYADRVDTPHGGSPTVMAFGDHYPSLDALLIDLSDGKVRDEQKIRPKRGNNSLESAIRTKYLQYVAAPLVYADGKTNLRITAHDVELGLLHGRDDGAGLVITSASAGRAQFTVPQSDLQSMFLTSAKSGAGRAGFFANDLQLKLSSKDSQSLSASVIVRGFWLLLPAGFEISGEVKVDGSYNAHFSNVRARGLDVGGGLLAGFLNNALKKYDGQVSPLAAFPGNRIHLKGLNISVDDSLHVDVLFGN